MDERPQLKRAVGQLGYFSLAFGSMIGVGWITGLKGMFEQAGPIGTTVAFVAGGVLMIAIGLCYAEAMQRLPVTGGEVAYAYSAYGTGRAFLVGWCLAFGYLAVSAFEAVSIGIVVSYLIDVDVWPLYDVAGSTVYGSHLGLALLFTAGIAFINWRGVGLATRVQAAMTILLVAFATVFVTAGVVRGDIANLLQTPADGGLVLGIGGVLAVFVTVPFWYVGFDTIPQAAEEREKGLSADRLGSVLVFAIAGSTVFYAAVFLSVGMVTPWRPIIEQPLPTAVAFETAFQSPLWSRLVLSAGLVGLLTSWNGFFLSGCRVLFALGRGRIIHPAFATTSTRYGTPTVAIAFSAAVTFAGALLGKAAVLVFVNVGSLGIAAAFLGVTLSLPKLRRHAGEPTTTMQRVTTFVGGLGSLTIILAMLIPGSPAMLPWPLDWLVLALVAITGIGLWLAASNIRNKTPEQTRRKLILDT